MKLSTVLIACALAAVVIAFSGCASNSAALGQKTRPCNVLLDGSCEIQQRVKNPLEEDSRPVQRIGLPMCTPEEFA